RSGVVEVDRAMVVVQSAIAKGRPRVSEPHWGSQSDHDGVHDAGAGLADVVHDEGSAAHQINRWDVGEWVGRRASKFWRRASFGFGEVVGGVDVEEFLRVLCGDVENGDFWEGGEGIEGAAVFGEHFFKRGEEGGG